MRTEQSSARADLTNWRALYRAALCETDQKKLPMRIAEAKRALIERSRELFAMQGGNADEAQAIDGAIYALGVFRNCLRVKTHRLLASDGDHQPAERRLRR